MPRGVYDRSKNKSQKSEKVATAAAPVTPKQVKKFGKKAQKAFAAPGAPIENVGGLGKNPNYELQAFLRDLTNLRATITSNGNNPSILGNGTGLVYQIDNQIEKAIKALGEFHFPVVEVKAEIAAPVVTNGAAAAPVAAPAPFNAPTYAPAPVAS